MAERASPWKPSAHQRREDRKATCEGRDQTPQNTAGLTAGSLGYSPWRYWLAVALGKSVIYVALALGGQALIPRLVP